MRPITKNLNIIEKQILNNNEIGANRWCAYAMLFFAGCNLLGWLLANIISDSVEMIFALVYFVNITVCLFGGLFVLANDCKSRINKYIICLSMGITCFTLQTSAFFGYDLLILSPIVVTIVYCDYFHTALAGINSVVIYLLSVAVSSVLALKFGEYNALGVEYAVTPEFSVRYNLDADVSLHWESFAALLNARSADIAYILLGIVIFTVLCCFLSKRGLDMLRETADVYEGRQKAEKEANEAKTKILISQLQPHFLYNSLSAIMAIDNNPPETVQALTEFSRYLRGNLNTITGADLIPFAVELEHVKHYTELEKLRFGAKLKVAYSIETDKFLLPPLTVQMTVENAIKHGVSKLENGGTVTVATKQTQGGVTITVTDDGCGFDVQSYTEKDIPGHFGLSSAKKRVALLTGGTYEIASEVGVGTLVTVFIPNNKEEDE